MALDFEKLKARFDESRGIKKEKKDGESKFWKPKFGEQIIRIVEPADGDPFKDFYFHYNVGKHSGFLCPQRNFGDNCAICDFASKLWQNGNPEDKRLAVKLFVTRRFFAFVLEKDEEGKLKFDVPKPYAHSEKVYNNFLKYIFNEDYKNFTDAHDGMDITLTYEKKEVTNQNGEKKTFPDTTFVLRPKRTPLYDGMSKKEGEGILATVPDIMEFMKRKTSQEVEQILNEWSHGEVEESDLDASDNDGRDYKEEKKKEKSGKQDAKKEDKKEDEKEQNPVDKAFQDLLG